MPARAAGPAVLFAGPLWGTRGVKAAVPDMLLETGSRKCGLGPKERPERVGNSGSHLPKLGAALSRVAEAAARERGGAETGGRGAGGEAGLVLDDL